MILYSPAQSSWAKYVLFFALSPSGVFSTCVLVLVGADTPRTRQPQPAGVVPAEPKQVLLMSRSVVQAGGPHAAIAAIKIGLLQWDLDQLGAAIRLAAQGGQGRAHADRGTWPSSTPSSTATGLNSRAIDFESVATWTSTYSFAARLAMTITTMAMQAIRMRTLRGMSR